MKNKNALGLISILLLIGLASGLYSINLGNPTTFNAGTDDSREYCTDITQPFGSGGQPDVAIYVHEGVTGCYGSTIKGGLFFEEEGLITYTSSGAPIYCKVPFEDGLNQEVTRVRIGIAYSNNPKSVYDGCFPNANTGQAGNEYDTGVSCAVNSECSCGEYCIGDTCWFYGYKPDGVTNYPQCFSYYACDEDGNVAEYDNDGVFISVLQTCIDGVQDCRDWPDGAHEVGCFNLEGNEPTNPPDNIEKYCGGELLYYWTGVNYASNQCEGRLSSQNKPMLCQEYTDINTGLTSAFCSDFDRDGGSIVEGEEHLYAACFNGADNECFVQFNGCPEGMPFFWTGDLDKDVKSCSDYAIDSHFSTWTYCKDADGFCFKEYDNVCSAGQKEYQTMRLCLYDGFDGFTSWLETLILNLLGPEYVPYAVLIAIIAIAIFLKYKQSQSINILK